MGMEVGGEAGVADGWIERVAVGLAVGLAVISGAIAGLGAGGRDMVQAASTVPNSKIGTS